MDSTPHDCLLLARQRRKYSLSLPCSGPSSIKCCWLLESIQIENAIKWQLQPKIKQWLATYPELSAADQKQIVHALHAAYRQSITTLSDVKIALPESIHNLLVEQEARSNSLWRGIEQQLVSWVKQARRSRSQRMNRLIVADKIKDAYNKHAIVLDLKDRQLTSLPCALGELTSLRVLSLRNNQLSTLPDTLNKLTLLTYIDCSGNSFAELPKILEQLPALEMAVFFENRPPASEQNQEILSRNGRAFHGKVAWKAKQFNESLEGWVQGGIEKERTKRVEAARRIQTVYDKRLDRLDLAGWELSDLPEALTHLHFLKELNISYNSLQQLPDWFNHLENLKIVRLEGNSFIKLPEVLKTMRVALDIARPGGSMTELAEQIEFENLIKEWINQEEPARVASKSGAADILLKAYLKKSIHLDLSNHQLPNLPEGIFSKLRQLRYVVLFNNQLQALPDDFSQLELKHLDLACNHFSKFPRVLWSMVTLEHLNLSCNALREISEKSVVELQ